MADLTLERLIKQDIASKLKEGVRVQAVQLYPDDWQALAGSLEETGHAWRAIQLDTSAGPVRVTRNAEVARGTWKISQWDGSREERTSYPIDEFARQLGSLANEVLPKDGPWRMAVARSIHDGYELRITFQWNGVLDVPAYPDPTKVVTEMNGLIDMMKASIGRAVGKQEDAR